MYSVKPSRRALCTQARTPWCTSSMRRYICTAADSALHRRRAQVNTLLQGVRVALTSCGTTFRDGTLSDRGRMCMRATHGTDEAEGRGRGRGSRAGWSRQKCDRWRQKESRCGIRPSRQPKIERPKPLVSSELALVALDGWRNAAGPGVELYKLGRCLPVGAAVHMQSDEMVMHTIQRYAVMEWRSVTTPELGSIKVN